LYPNKIIRNNIGGKKKKRREKKKGGLLFKLQYDTKVGMHGHAWTNWGIYWDEIVFRNFPVHNCLTKQENSQTKIIL